jgi:hypothetical protein
MNSFLSLIWRRLFLNISLSSSGVHSRGLSLDQSESEEKSVCSKESDDGVRQSMSISTLNNEV